MAVSLFSQASFSTNQDFANSLCKQMSEMINSLEKKLNTLSDFCINSLGKKSIIGRLSDFREKKEEVFLFFKNNLEKLPEEKAEELFFKFKDLIVKEQSLFYILCEKLGESFLDALWSEVEVGEDRRLYGRPFYLSEMSSKSLKDRRRPEPIQRVSESSFSPLVDGVVGGFFMGRPICASLPNTKQRPVKVPYPPPSWYNRTPYVPDP